jgi:hypothetical protein
MRANPSRCRGLTCARWRRVRRAGEDKYQINRYLRERGDANIKTNADLIAKATFYDDPNFPEPAGGARAGRTRHRAGYSARMHTRFALQTLLVNCMQEQKLDALVAPMSTVPPRKLLSPREPPATAATRSAGSCSASRVSGDRRAGRLHDRRVGSRGAGNETRLVGPVAAKLPVGVDFIARPFGEPLLFRIAAAYEAATKNRRPPDGFGPLP